MGLSLLASADPGLLPTPSPQWWLAPFAALVDNAPLEGQGQNTWVHVLLLRRGDFVSLRVNGQGTATVDVRGQTFTPVTAALLGVQRHGYPWRGRIDDVTVWSRALDVGELAALAAGARPNQPQ